MLIKDLFYIQSGGTIGEREVYENKGTFPMVTAQTKGDGIAWTIDEAYVREREPQNVIDEECLTWTKNGSKCGKVFYRNYSFYSNADNGVLLLKEKYKKDIDLQYFAYALNSVTDKYVTSRDSKGKLNNAVMSNIDVSALLIDIQEQRCIAKKIREISDLKDALKRLHSELTILLGRQVACDANQSSDESMLIEDLFYVKTGARIIEEEVYQNPGDFPCVTSQTANNGIAWYADINWLDAEYKEKIIRADECLTWTKDGAKCGTFFYRDYAFYPNDHCGVLIPKEEYVRRINLKWFMYTYRKYISTYITSSDNQGMLYNGVVRKIKIPAYLPPIEHQNDIAKRYEEMETMADNIEQALSMIDLIIS
ncbi:MAG: restriction endonuclease subunit S [Mogibacterium sp.]|nr:restriction endonuclease subunit S [Mogibacterium sp.]